VDQFNWCRTLVLDLVGVVLCELAGLLHGLPVAFPLLKAMRLQTDTEWKACFELRLHALPPAVTLSLANSHLLPACVFFKVPRYRPLFENSNAANLVFRACA
jgi:hypothetical protein